MTASDFGRAQWRKSIRSQTQGDACVEVAGSRGHIAVRDSKNPAAGHLILDATTWLALLTDIKSDHLN
jgi:hypothetical protein